VKRQDWIDIDVGHRRTCSPISASSVRGREAVPTRLCEVVRRLREGWERRPGAAMCEQRTEHADAFG